MTDFSQYTDQQLAEAIAFYRRQRNLSATINEAAHVRAKNFVRLAEAEQSRRLEEAKKPKPGHNAMVLAKNIAKINASIKKEESEHIDEAASPNQYIEVTNKFTGKKTHHEVHPSKAFAALNHHKSLWNTKSARIVSGKEAEDIKSSKMNEEAEQIDELSNKTLGSYINKAARDVYRRGHDETMHTHAEVETKKKADKARHSSLATAAGRKGINRLSGIVKATQKISSGETGSSDETRNKNLGSYIQKSAEDIHKRGGDAAISKRGLVTKKGHQDIPLHARNLTTAKNAAIKRLSGIEKATQKLAKEEVDLDEASKEHLERLKTMLDKAKPGSADHSQIRHAISSMYGDEHIPAKHKNVKPDMYEEVETEKNWVDKVKGDGYTIQKHSKTGKQRTVYAKGETKEEAEINEASLLGPQGAIHKQASVDQSDREYLKQMAFKNAWKAKNPGKPWPGYEKAGFKEEVEINEASDLRITKIYNKWPKKATYAVHTPDRKYFKEFDSMEAAKAHHDEKTNNK